MSISRPTRAGEAGGDGDPVVTRVNGSTVWALAARARSRLASRARRENAAAVRG